MSEFQFEAPLWEWSGKGRWHFVTVPQELSGIIRLRHERKPGFGSVRVTASIQGRQWKTSLFPDAKSGCYFLPVKAEVRRTRGLKQGDTLSVLLCFPDMI